MIVFYFTYSLYYEIYRRVKDFITALRKSKTKYENNYIHFIFVINNYHKQIRRKKIEYLK